MKANREHLSFLTIGTRPLPYIRHLQPSLMVSTQVQEDVGRLKRHWPADFIQVGGRTYELVGVYGILLTYERMHLVLAQHLQLGR